MATPMGYRLGLRSVMLTGYRLGWRLGWHLAKLRAMRSETHLVMLKANLMVMRSDLPTGFLMHLPTVKRLVTLKEMRLGYLMGSHLDLH